MNEPQPEDIRNRLLVARLPAMPQILLKLLQMCQADEVGMTELAKLIANDAAMTTRVLQVANSAAYQRSGRKVGLMQALSVLGADQVKSLIVSGSVLQAFSGFPHTASLDLRGFWKHALTAAVVARGIAKLMAYAQIQEAYLAGLLHDVGRLALLAAAPEVYHINFQTPDNENLCAIEQRTLQISHAEAGAWLIERWQMDSFIADSVLYHHEDSARLETAHPLIRIVHLSHLLSDQPPDQPLVADIGAICALTDEQVQAIYQAAGAQVKLAAEQLGIDLAGVAKLAVSAAVASPMPAASPLQQRLTEEIRNRALIAELGQLFARQRDDAHLLESVRQNVRILFDLDDTVVFLMNGGGQALIGASFGGQRQRLAELAISLTGGGGLAESVLQRSLVFVSQERGPLSLVEEQLLRVFGTQCLICLPIASSTRSLGLLVGSVESWRVAELKRQEKFLLAFGAQVARALENSARERGEIDRRIARLRDEHLLDSRKVAHEVNNPLAIIKNYLGVLDDKLARDEPVAAELSILNGEVDRVGSIIKQFAGITPAPPDSVVEINQVINDIVRLFRGSRFLPASVQIIAQLPGQSCEITGVASVLKQIFANLIKNAVEAMPKGGRVEVINRGAVRRDRVDYFAMLVRDTGPGLPDAVMARLFSPVRSSKPGENRGLGLSIVHDLVQKLHGQINCNSSNLGTAFEILLPRRPSKSAI